METNNVKVDALKGSRSAAVERVMNNGFMSKIVEHLTYDGSLVLESEDKEGYIKVRNSINHLNISKFPQFRKFLKENGFKSYGGGFWMNASKMDKMAFLIELLYKFISDNGVKYIKVAYGSSDESGWSELTVRGYSDLGELPWYRFGERELYKVFHYVAEDGKIIDFQTLGLDGCIKGLTELKERVEAVKSAEA